MKNIAFIAFGMLLGILMIFAFLWSGPSSLAHADVNLPQSESTPLPDELSNNGVGDTTAPQAEDLTDEILPADNALMEFDLPTPIPGETLVYFVPTDNDASATVLYLYNTDSVSHIVALRGFSYNGVLVYSLNINIGATSFIRLASDSIAAAPPPSWATPAPIITNFTDFTYFASLSLPKGVKAEGYTLFNPGTGTIDPRKDQGAIPLRFSTDPNSVFLPSLQR